MRKQFVPVEIATLVYSIITAIYILLFYNKIPTASNLLLLRVGIILIVVSLSYVIKKHGKFGCLRCILPLVLIMHWYPETYYFNNNVLVCNLDAFFEKLDFDMMGFSPSLEFSKAFPQAWVSELMYFGYFAFYLMVVFIVLYTIIVKKEYTSIVSSIILISFMLYYIVFIFVPVSGPQFYYPPELVEVPEGYLFSNMVVFMQDMGEKPTGAFPSSHVGLCLIYMRIIYKYIKKMFWILLPVALILMASTVYIKAHYLVDVIAAFIVTPIIYMCSIYIYNKFKENNELI